MSSYIQPLERVLKSYLPTGAVLIQILDPEPHKAVFAADITGDQVAELTAIYRMNDELYLIVLMCRHGVWTVAANLRGQGYGVTSMTAVPIIHAGLNNLVVGWQIGAIWSKLSVYAWTPEGLQDATPVDMSYSYIDFVHVPGPGGGQTPIAIWIHDTGDAYRVDVLRYLDGRFVAAPDAYQSYYPVVVKYYERLTRQHPDYAYYWYYLADAQLRAGDPVAGLVSVRNAIHLEGTYPSRETLLELESRIIKAIELTRSGRSIDLFPASVKIIGGTKWGYINQAGQWIIAPQFEEANDYQANGLAIVSTMGKYGIIDRTGRYVVEPIYQSISPYSEHRAAVLDAEGFRLIDEKGHVLTRQAYPYISSVQHGRAVFNIASTTDSGSSRYGYLDAQGRVAIPAQYAEANDFDKNGKAVVKMNDREYALIGLQGQQLITYPYPFVGPQGDGLLAFQETSDGKYGYIDERGKAVIEPAYTSAFPFHDGRAIVNTAEDFKSQYGVINRQGQYIVQPEYNDIRDLGEGRFALGRAKNADQPYIGSIYAIANWDGGRLTDFLYDDISDYHDGLASVYDGQYTYFVDRFGKAAAGYPQVKGSGSLRLMPGGLIQAMVDLRLMYITKQGEVIWQQNTVIPLRPPYMVREGKYDPSPNYLVYYPQVDGMVNQAAERIVNAKLMEMSQVKRLPEQPLDYTYTGDYEVVFFHKTLLELELNGYNYPFGAAHGMPSRMYAIINLSNGHMYSLQELFKPGSRYLEELSRLVGQQIKNDPQYAYVFPGSYTGIKADQLFYVTNEALHLVFAPYDIGPYAVGFPEFTIPFDDIMNIVNTEGEFWQSFH